MSKEKPNSLPLDKVNERIKHWTIEVEMMNNRKVPTNTSKAIKFNQTKDTNEKLLSYWIGYKNLHFPNN